MGQFDVKHQRYELVRGEIESVRKLISVATESGPLRDSTDSLLWRALKGCDIARQLLGDEHHFVPEQTRANLLSEIENLETLAQGVLQQRNPT